MNPITTYINALLAKPQGMSQDEIAAQYAGMAPPNATGPELGQHLMGSPIQGQREAATNYMLRSAGVEARESENYLRQKQARKDIGQYIGEHGLNTKAKTLAASKYPFITQDLGSLFNQTTIEEKLGALESNPALNTPANRSEAILGRPNVASQGNWEFVDKAAPEIAEKLDPAIRAVTQINSVTGALRELERLNPTEQAQGTRTRAMDLSAENIEHIVSKPDFNINPLEALTRSLADNLPYFGPALVGPLFNVIADNDVKAYAQQMSNFISATRGYESGAQVPFTEFARDMGAYGIQPGDDLEMRKMRVFAIKQRVNQVKNKPMTTLRAYEKQQNKWSERDAKDLERLSNMTEYTTAKGRTVKRQDIIDTIKYQSEKLGRYVSLDEILEAIEAKRQWP